MDKIHKPPQLDGALQGKLHPLTQEFGIASIFYHAPTFSVLAQIVIVAFKNKDVEVIESRKWIRNSLQNQQIIFHIITVQKMEFSFGKGNPFMARYCHSKSLIYQSPYSINLIETDWKSFKKKYHKFEEQFYHDHDILYSEANSMNKHEVDVATILLLKSVYCHDLDYLEELYFGKNYSNQNLHQRIKKLSQIKPEIESFFVKENDTKYFLLNEFDRAIEDTKQGELYFSDRMLAQLNKTETKLYHLISERFSELKELIKSEDKLINELILNPQKEASELSRIITKIISIKPVEEIYLFDKKQNAKGFVYYLLLIGIHLGTEILNKLQESISANFHKTCTIVLIGHSRIWIQKEHFIHQEFFQKIMIPENKVYESHPYHPATHWEPFFTSEFQDLKIYYGAAKQLADNYFIIRKNAENENTAGLFEWFSIIILRIFRTFIFSKSAYLPHYLSAFTLWELCLHFEPKLEKIEFLFEKLYNEDFHKTIDYQSQYHHVSYKISESDLIIMDEILTVLSAELDKSVKSVNKEIVETIKTANS